ncbi:MAG: spermidine/putrescine ABC transporter substrate-binding protein [Thermoleophilia bacterium]|nr:spermidine/putrescine ABC transporter substrate-binding protein [Thermoleophilia bacterium]
MNDPISRRQLLGRAAAGGAGLSLAALLAACGGGGGIEGGGETTAPPATTAPPETTATGGAETTAPPKELGDIVWSNWQLYLDTDESGNHYPTLEAFEQEYGIDVEYLEGDINSNEEFFAKIRGQLEQGQDVGRDLIVLTDTSGVPGRMIELGFLEQLDKEAIPNIVNLLDVHASPPFDPNRDYSLPWQGGMTGIGYDPTKVGGDVTSLEQLFTDPKLKGKVTFVTDMGDTIGLAALLNGDDPSAMTDESFDRALATVQAAVDSGQVRQFTGNEYSSLLAQGDVWACIAWSGDLVQLQYDNPNLVWVQPVEGGMRWTDQLLIPKGADAFTASTLINWYYDPQIAAQAAAWINYISPVKGAKEALIASDPEIANNPLIFPSEETLAKSKLFDVNASNNDAYKAKFQALLGA